MNLKSVIASLLTPISVVVASTMPSFIKRYRSIVVVIGMVVIGVAIKDTVVVIAMIVCTVMVVAIIVWMVLVHAAIVCMVMGVARIVWTVLVVATSITAMLVTKLISLIIWWKRKCLYPWVAIMETSTV